MVSKRKEVKDMYIKIDDLLNATVRKNPIWSHITNEKGQNLSMIVNTLPRYKDKVRSKKKGKEK